MAIIGKNLEIGSNKASIPSAYKLDHIFITNYKGERQDIKFLAVKMEISESLYSQSLTLKLTLKDSTNFIEEFPLIGQEKIEVILNYKKRNGDPKNLKLKFFISEYPTYGTSDKQVYVQVITLVGISEQSYISNQKKISRSYLNNTVNEIEKILTEDLNLPKRKFKHSGDSISSSKGIISNQRPMDVIEWFRRQSYAEDSFSPFFFFQTLNGKYRLFSLSSLISEDNKVFDKYFDSRDFTTDPNSDEDFRQREQRILKVSSDLKLNKSIQSRRGAFASQNNYLDYSNKTYTKYEYDYSTDFSDKPSLEGKKILSDKFLIGDDKLTDFTRAHCEYISVNSKSFEGNNNYNDMSKISRHFINAYNALFNTFTHDIRLNGNFKLNAGRKIQLEFPKAIDPVAYRELSKNPKDHHRNEFLSGKYLITSAIHEFSDDEYYVNLRVKRDSFSVDLDDSPKQP
tara:strand:- start:90 stop:1457 length:1368 start_codon:yes stop_codon:yes gene_type:complete